MAATRTPSDVYRHRSLDEWVHAVGSTGATSLTHWATVSRTSYNAARVLGLHRHIASALRWNSKLPNGALATLTPEDFARRFLAHGVKTPSDMWRVNNAWCKVLKRQGHFDTVRQLIQVEYVIRRHTPTLEYFLQQCRQFDFFEAWTCADRVAAATARRLGLTDAIRQQCRRRPAAFVTRGGPVTSLAALVVARLLEHNDIHFATEPVYPFKTLGARMHSQRGDFLLPGNLWLEIWMHANNDAPRWPRTRRYLLRRKLKTRLCKRHDLRLVSIEGSLLHRSSLAVFVEHCAIVLKHTATHVVTDIEPRDLLAIECAPDEVRDDARPAS